MKHLTFGDDYSRTDAAFLAWSNALKAGTHPGKFRLYWLFFDTITDGDNVPDGINRYIFHGADFDLMANKNQSFVYVHIPGVFIFGMTEDHDQSIWKDLRVSFNGGRYKHQNRTVPGEIGQIIRSKVLLANEAKASVSPAQQAKIAADALRNPEALLKSPLARATFADLKFEGH